MTSPRRRAARFLLAVLALAGCTPDPLRPPTPGDPPVGAPAGTPQVLVVNTLSETISRLDLSTGAFSVQAAVTGTWTNRITAAANGTLFLVADSGSNEIALHDAADLARIGAIDLGPGSNPWLARAVDARRGVASSWLKGEVRLLDLAHGTAGAAIPTTPGPEGFVVLGETAFVACTNFLGSEGSFGEGRLDVVDLAAARVVASIPVGTNPQDVVLGPDGMLHVLCTGDYSPAGPGRAVVVDPSLHAVAATVPLAGAPGRIAVAPDGAMWVVGHAGGVQRYDPFSRAILPGPADSALQSARLSAIAADEAGGRVYVTAFEDDLLIAVDAAAGTVAEAWIVGDGPVDVLVSRP
jgi:DNA-binding beta-propeller fold protein YncE